MFCAILSGSRKRYRSVCGKGEGMPYTNIVFIKLEKRLFNDPRWYMMSDQAQLNYIKFLLFAAETYNKIPKNLEAIKKGFKTDQDLETIKKTIEEIKANFPKFKENKHFYYFEGFEEKTNYLIKKEFRRKSQGNPLDCPDKDKDKDKDKEEDIVINNPTGSVNKSVENSKSSLTHIEKEVLQQVYSRGVNIYALLEEFKNEHRIYPPKEILIGICRQGLILEQKGEIKSGLYPYLKTSLHRAYLDMEHNQWKKEGVANSIKEILAGIGRETKNKND